MNERVLQKRSGSRTRTTPTNLHTQLEQNPEREVVDELAARAFALPGVEERPSAISVPGARTLWLREEIPPLSSRLVPMPYSAVFTTWPV